MKRIFLWFFVVAALAACGGGGDSSSGGAQTPEPPPPVSPPPVPPPPPPVFHAGMPQVNVGQNNMTVTLGFAGELVLGFLPATKEIRLADVAKVCVDSDNLGWGNDSSRCIVPNAVGVTEVSNTVTNDCFQIHLKLKDESIVWSNLDKLEMTGRQATKVTANSSQCLRYGVAPAPAPVTPPPPVSPLPPPPVLPTPPPPPIVPSLFHAGMPEVNVGQNSMTVTLGFAGDLLLGFLPAEKAVRLADVATVCVDSNNLGWGNSSNRCVVPNAVGVAVIADTVANDCIQFHLKLKDSSIMWANIDSLAMTGRPATVTAGCLQY